MQGSKFLGYFLFCLSLYAEQRDPFSFAQRSSTPSEPLLEISQQDNETAIPKKLVIGDTVDGGWTVKSINDMIVVLQKGTAVRKVSLDPLQKETKN